MIKILHSGDWHLDAPLLFSDVAQRDRLRQELAAVPQKIATLCKAHNCDLLLLSGDLFDGAYALDTLQQLKSALQQVEVPVFITPGNHDFVGADSPWLTESFSSNVHIFTHPVIESVALPHLDCRVYGAGFTAMDCPSLLSDFTLKQEETYAIGVLHGDPTQISSPYNPVTKEQVKGSGLDYLALGHIHKGDSFRAGKTLCAWPGCPMGHGYDETGEKGVLLVTVDETVTAEFIPLNTPRFYDLEVDATASLDDILPPVGNEDHYRITFIGSSEPLDLAAIAGSYSRFPNLLLRDKPTAPVDLWGSAGEDTLEGKYFKLLQDSLENADEETQRKLRLAAEISRKLLDGQEVVLP